MALYTSKDLLFWKVYLLYTIILINDKQGDSIRKTNTPNNNITSIIIGIVMIKTPANVMSNDLITPTSSILWTNRAKVVESTQTIFIVINRENKKLR